MTLHVLQLGPYPPPEGGISRNILAIREAVLLRGGRSSIVVTSRSSRVRGEPGVYHPRLAVGLIGLLARIRFDVLHLHIGGDIIARVLSLALACAVFGRGKSVLTLHSGEYPRTKEGKAAKRWSIRGFIFRRFNRIIVVNTEMAEVFERYGVPRHNIRIIPPFSLRSPDPKVQVPADFTGFCLNHTPVLLAVGGLERDYDPLFLIGAIKDVFTEFPQAGLMIVGGGSLRDEVERAVASSGYADNICIAGDVEHAVTLHLIDKADVFLRTTLFDGDAISVHEALFLGTPVIATDNGMRPPGVNLIKIGDKEQLQGKIRDLVQMGKKVRPENPPDNSNIKAIVDLYEEIAGSEFKH